MDIRCPKCGRRGRLPDRWVPEAHSLRCRRCRALFKVPGVARLAVEQGARPEFDPVGVEGRTPPTSAMMAGGFFDAFDEAGIGPRPKGPGDSNYELTFTLQDIDGDSGSDWAAEAGAYEPEAPSSDEMPAVAPAGPEPWHHRFVESWALGLIVVALVLIAISVAAIAWLLGRALDPGQPIDRPTHGLIAGFACAVALLVVSVPLTLLAASVTELVRDLRRLDRRGGLLGHIGRR